jgi:transposase-like protein
MLLGVATRRYARSLEPLPAEVRSRGASKSSVSRRFVARTTAQVRAWQTATLEHLDLVALLIDGVVLGERCLVVALGLDATGQKHPLGVWDGSTENATVCQGLLGNLQSRGLRTDRSILVIVDGSKALRSAVTQTLGQAACVQRCQVHKTRNVLDYLSDRQRPWVHAILRRAYASDDAAKARRLLEDLARRLDDEFPSAAESVREGLDETLTVLRLGLFRAPASLVGHDKSHREPHEPDASGASQCEAVAQRQDDDSLDDGRRVRSGEGIPTGERLQGSASARHRPPSAR